VPEYEGGFARTHDALGYGYLITEQPNKAEATFQKAGLMWDRLTHDSPNVYGHQEGLAGHLTFTANFYQANGQFNEAEKALERSIGLLERLARDGSKNPSLASTLGGCYYTMGHLV